MKLKLPLIPSTVAVRLGLGYGLLVTGSMAVIAFLFYVGTVGVLSQSIDRKLEKLSQHLVFLARERGSDAVRGEIRRLLDDSLERDTEVYLLADQQGIPVIGNLAGLPVPMPTGRLLDADVVRAGRASSSRLLAITLPTGEMLVVGRDMQDLQLIRQVVWHALGTGGLVALLLAIGGALLFRQQIERHLGQIRGTLSQVETGDLSARVPESSSRDEFARLGRSINHMLARVEQLMEGVRHVSNAIAHDLRTPLGRIRGRLEQALRRQEGADTLRQAVGDAIGDIDDLIDVFHKLLQIAEAEAGTCRSSFVPVSLAPLVANVAELYDAMAEDLGVVFSAQVEGAPTVMGDKDLLAGALANLVDNALKYAGPGRAVMVRAYERGDEVVLSVQDNGPGIPAQERDRVVQRFYRLDTGRSQPGNGLGLPIVESVASLHGGRLDLGDAGPGLVASLILPRV